MTLDSTEFCRSGNYLCQIGKKELLFEDKSKLANIKETKGSENQNAQK